MTDTPAKITIDEAAGRTSDSKESSDRLPIHGAPARASEYLVRFSGALLDAAGLGPVLDLACGDGRNGLYLAALGAGVLLVDISEEALPNIRELPRSDRVSFLRLDLEAPEPLPFEPGSCGAVLVFRYLHRPLIQPLRDCLAPGGMFVYETFLQGQEAFGKPRNPVHLLSPGELAAWFGDWEILDLFEGRLENPPRIMGRIACRKPAVASAPKTVAVASGPCS